jgi:hypothetical protein
MKKILPHEANRKTYLYTAYSAHYRHTIHVVANSLKDARARGIFETRRTFGNHAQIHRDEVTPLP